MAQNNQIPKLCKVCNMNSSSRESIDKGNSNFCGMDLKSAMYCSFQLDKGSYLKSS